MTRKHDTTNAPSIKALSASIRLAYYQAHHDCREAARTTYRNSCQAVGRAYIVAVYAPMKGAGQIVDCLVTRLYAATTEAGFNADSAAGLRAEIARELACARAALSQRRTYGADKALARRAIGRARHLREALADFADDQPARVKITGKWGFAGQTV